MLIPTKLYGGDVELTFNEFKHSYYVDSEKIPSVTTVLSVINKPALVGWAAKMAVAFIENELKPGVAMDEIQIATMLDMARKSWNKKRGDAADMGKFVHNWISEYILGRKPQMPVNEQLQEAILAFLDWEKKHKVKFLLTEEPIYSRQHNYAGTLDFICRIDGELVLGDIKTSSGIWTEYWLEVAGYRNARVE